MRRAKGDRFFFIIIVFIIKRINGIRRELKLNID